MVTECDILKGKQLPLIMQNGLSDVAWKSFFSGAATYPVGNEMLPRMKVLVAYGSSIGISPYSHLGVA